MKTRKIEIYKDKKGGFRWRVVSTNGQTVSTPGESFTRKDSARRSALRNYPDLPIVDLTKGKGNK